MAEHETLSATAGGSGLGRRGLMKSAGLSAVALGTIGGATVGASTDASAQTATPSQTDVLNFALNLEYLEAEYYVRAVTGQPLSVYINDLASGDGTVAAGAVAGGTLVPFQNPALAYYALRIANDELTHVKLLRELLGTSAVAEPEIDFATSFANLAIAAGLATQGGAAFDPFSNEVDFLLGAYIFEDVGVTAYAGAASLLTGANLTYAASVLSVEAYHAGAIRGYLSRIGAGDATNAISALRASLAGAADDNGTDYNGNPYAFNNVDYNGTSYRRTPEQVLNIVYGSTTAASGLFFPLGVNGGITRTTT